MENYLYGCISENIYAGFTSYQKVLFNIILTTFSLTINSRGLSEPSQNGIGEIIDELPDGVILKQTILVNNVPLDIPFWIVDGFQNTDHGFYTDSEFERSSLIKVSYCKVVVLVASNEIEVTCSINNP